MMLEKNVGGVGVLNGDGEIKGALSLVDLKIVSQDNKFFEKLYKKTKDFLKDLDSTYAERPYLIKTATMKDTIEDVVHKLHIWNLHRIYVVDRFKRPIGVVGIREILNEIIS